MNRDPLIQSQSRQGQQQLQQGYNAPLVGIAQPPHSAGTHVPAKIRAKIDPDHIPSPVVVQEADQLLYDVEPYLTCSRTAAPLATTDFIAVDQGSFSHTLVEVSDKF